MSIEALRTAIAAEHAAIFGYGMVGAFLTNERQTQARQAEALHRDRRDAAALRIEAGGGALVPAEPAYALPFRVTDADSAMRLAVVLEEGAAGAWREALGGTTDDDRRFALDSLITCAVMATRWRVAAGMQPRTLTFPGGVS